MDQDVYCKNLEKHLKGIISTIVTIAFQLQGNSVFAFCSNMTQEDRRNCVRPFNYINPKQARFFRIWSGRGGGGFLPCVTSLFEDQ